MLIYKVLCTFNRADKFRLLSDGSSLLLISLVISLIASLVLAISFFFWSRVLGVKGTWSGVLLLSFIVLTWYLLCPECLSVSVLELVEVSLMCK
jgi:hypothetical protein